MAEKTVTLNPIEQSDPGGQSMMNQQTTTPMASPSEDELKVYFADDPNSGRAGQGLAVAPFIHHILGKESSKYWMMSPAEQAALIYLLEHIRPRVAIEIGTCLGGSLQVLSKFSSKVYSLDVDPEVEQRLAGEFNNVEFIIGPSPVTLPRLIEKLTREGAPLEFVLVDGDHSARGVETDINNILEFVPTSAPLYITMHDSFNPECRKGLLDAKWARNLCVRVVELDFVSGTVNPTPNCRGELWGGLALAILLPGKRESRFEVTKRSQLTIEQLSKVWDRRRLTGLFQHGLRRFFRST